jgi:hypothetical protein
MKQILILAFALLGGIGQANAAAAIGNLQVEYRNTPLGIDMKAGSQVFQPRLTSHGYQYVEITGIDKFIRLDELEVLSQQQVIPPTRSPIP